MATPNSFSANTTTVAVSITGTADDHQEVPSLLVVAVKKMLKEARFGAVSQTGSEVYQLSFKKNSPEIERVGINGFVHSHSCTSSRTINR
ncbi:MAG: hypothetical protein HKP20_05550 [Akkermansiaceae bacterium]|nr:hypothetical protein [Akkermansiaceae bacterium]